MVFYRNLHVCMYKVVLSATVPLGTDGVLIRPLLVTESGSCWSVALGMVCGCPSWFLKS